MLRGQRQIGATAEQIGYQILGHVSTHLHIKTTFLIRYNDHDLLKENNGRFYGTTLTKRMIMQLRDNQSTTETVSLDKLETRVMIT